MRIIQVFDLTHRLSTDTPVHPLDTPVHIERPITHRPHRMTVSSLELSSHAGTHMDAPYHILEDGRTLDQYPVSRFLGPAVTLDLREGVGAISRDELVAAAGAAGGLQPGDFALVCTGWDAHYDRAHMFDHRFLSEGAATYLRDQGASLVGVDVPSVDSSAGVGEGAKVNPLDLVAHRALMAADILIVEGLQGLVQILGRRVWFAALPLHVLGAEGAPVRAVAWLAE